MVLVRGLLFGLCVAGAVAWAAPWIGRMFLAWPWQTTVVVWLFLVGGVPFLWFRLERLAGDLSAWRRERTATASSGKRRKGD